ncbi:hypothetical protein Tco_0775359, partial [Tanacetum coccineum]
DDDGGVDVAMVVAAGDDGDGAWGAWFSGSGRSSYGDGFQKLARKLAGKVFRRRRDGGGRRFGRWLPDMREREVGGNMKRASKGYSGENIPLFPTIIVQGPVVQGERSTHPVEQESVVPQPRSPTQTHVADEAASTGVDVRYGGAATTITGLEAGQGSDNIDKTPTMPPRFTSPKMESLEADLKQTKLTYGASYTKLIKKVEKLENKVKSNQARRRAEIVVSNDEEDLEDPSKQGRKISEIDQDPTILLVQQDAEIQGRQEHDMEFEFDLDAAKDVSTAEEDISTAKPVSTAGATVTTASVDVSTATVSTAKDKAALRLQAKLEEEESQRIASVQEAASSFNIKEWDDIQARVEANKELAQRLQAEERKKYFEDEKARLLAKLINKRKRYFVAQKTKERRNKPPTQAQQRTYMSNYIKHMGAYTLQQLRSYSFDEIKNLFETTMRRVHTFVLMDSDIETTILESTVGSSKRDAEEELAQESSKRQKTRESSVSAKEPKDNEEELS